MRGDAGGGLSSGPRAAWAARPERGHATAIRCGVWLALALGRPLARLLLLHPLTLYYLAASAADRAASRQYLRRVFGREPGLPDVYRHFYTFATVLLDRVYLLHGQYRRFEVRVHGREIVDAELARGRGCLLVGAHLGSFEVARFLARDSAGPRVALVMYEENAGALRAVLDAIDPDAAMPVIALGRPDSMLRLEQALADGGFAGMLADRSFSGEGALSRPFLGAPARFATGPFRLAAALHRPLVLMLGLHAGGNRYDVHFERLAGPEWGDRAGRDRAIESALSRYVERLEHYCRERPYNWFNFYDYWR